ncbi:MAG TPA: hypothetical protein VFK44_07460 [Bacillales bacterium]|nr:hypothetical protein [Bacillales bacterium]
MSYPQIPYAIGAKMTGIGAKRGFICAKTASIGAKTASIGAKQNMHDSCPRAKHWRLLRCCEAEDVQRAINPEFPIGAMLAGSPAVDITPR